MYHIIGADGKGYGPVSIETLTQWITQGRVNATTRLRIEGSTEWRDLASVHELAAAIEAKSEPIPPSQTAAPVYGAIQFHNSVVGDAMARDAISNDYRFDISRCFSRAWEILLANLWLSIGTSVLIMLITMIASVVPFASLLLTSVLLGGLNWMFLKMLRGQPVEINDAFAGFSFAFIPLILCSIVSQLLTGLGFILCVLPGIYLTVAWIPFSTLLIMDKKLDFWPAMELSRKVISNHWWQMFGFLLLCLLVNLAGSALLCVGILFTMPLTTIATVVAYEEVFARVSTPQSATLTPPTSVV